MRTSVLLCVWLFSCSGAASANSCNEEVCQASDHDDKASMLQSRMKVNTNLNTDAFTGVDNEVVTKRELSVNDVEGIIGSGREACALAVVVSGAESVRDTHMGRYTKSLKQGSQNNGNRPIYASRNGEQLYMYYWAPTGYWIIGDDYDDSFGKLSARSKAYCPSHASGWKVWWDNAWQSTYAISIEEALGHSGDGSDYRGYVSTTRSGRTCQAWSSQSPHTHHMDPSEKPNSGLISNYCRNPDGEPTIWCYTTDSAKRWEFCDLAQACRMEDLCTGCDISGNEHRIGQHYTLSQCINTCLGDASCLGIDFGKGKRAGDCYLNTQQGTNYGSHGDFDGYTKNCEAD